jgi:hypothetical protein
MSEFERKIDPRNLASLQHLADEPDTNWWKDLLTLWRPSGSNAQDRGLRLAIRNNYLNFYRRGQSVACVRFSKAHEPYAQTHIKYAFEGATGQSYAQMRDGTNIKTKTGQTTRYEGSSTLDEWIRLADRHKGLEKTCVDELIACNPSIIDVEMGLPASGDRKTAQRMDCVALERAGDEIRIVFWEAKMIDDPRLRSRTIPEVMAQLKIYTTYLDDSHRRSVEVAYRTVCRLLIALHTMTEKLWDRPSSLDPLVIAAAKDACALSVDRKPRLAIFGGELYKEKGNWDFHLDRLKAEEVHCRVFDVKPYSLRQAEAGS